MLFIALRTLSTQLLWVRFSLSLASQIMTPSPRIAQIAPLDLRSKRKVSKKCYLCKEVNQRREVNYK